MVGKAGNSIAPNAGFTLLELLVVLAIAGLLVTLVPPLVSAAVPGAAVKSAARDLVVTLRDARNDAISSGVSVEVTFDFESGSYQVAGGPARRFPDGTNITLLADGTGDAEIFHSIDHSLADNLYGLHFHPDGSSSGAAFRLGRSATFYRISVDWLMGRVTLSEPEPHES